MTISNNEINLEITTDEDATFSEDKATPKWLQFEHDVIFTLKELDPHAEVLHNQIVTGIISGTPRQLDAVAKKRIVGADNDVAIECKLYNRKLGIGKIDEFVGKLLDVGASLGILYASNGVSGPAMLRANAASNPRIILRDLSDVTPHLASATPGFDHSYYESHAKDFSEVIEEAVFSNCQSDMCWGGEVALDETDGIPVGYCGSCGLLHVQCLCCEELLEIYDWSGSECFVCGAEYSVLSYQGEIDGLEQISHGVDCAQTHLKAELPNVQ